MRIESKDGVIAGIDDWYQFAHPKRTEHWKAGRSAFESARSWFGTDWKPAVPPEIASLLDSHDDTRGASITRVLPEHQVRFDSLPGEPRNTDVAVLATQPSGRIAISIEAKADETFDLRVRQVLQAAVRKISDDGRTNAITRIQGIADAWVPSRVEGSPSLGDIRYQLRTGVAGAIKFVAEHQCARAVFIVHELVSSATASDRRAANGQDLDAFVRRMTSGGIRQLSDGRLVGPIAISAVAPGGSPIRLYVGKIHRDVAVLEPTRTERHEAGYDYRARYAGLEPDRQGEGGAVYVGSRDGEHVIVSDERVLGDLRPDLERECITVHTFGSIAARDAFAARQFPSRARRTGGAGLSQDDLHG